MKSRVIIILGIFFVLSISGCSGISKNFIGEENITIKYNNQVIKENNLLKPINLEVGIAKGEIAPDFKLEDIRGKTFSLNDFRGKNILVNFWLESFSGQQEMSALSKLNTLYKEKDITVIGVNIGDNKLQLEKFIKKNNYNILILLDKNKEISKLYNIFSIPSTFFIDENGIIKKKIIGSRSLEQYEKICNELFLN